MVKRLTALKLIWALATMFAALSCAGGGGSPRPAADGLRPRPAPVQVGETAPDFTLADQNNQQVSLSSARGRAPVVLVFYRGHW